MDGRKNENKDRDLDADAFMDVLTSYGLLFNFLVRFTS